MLYRAAIDYIADWEARYEKDGNNITITADEAVTAIRGLDHFEGQKLFLFATMFISALAVTEEPSFATVFGQWKVFCAANNL